MSGARGKRALAIVALLLGATAGMRAQAGTPPSLGADGAERGALSGRLTDLHSAPVAGVTVILRNERTGAEERSTTSKNGAYRFSALEPGMYTLRAESERVGHGQVEGLEVDAGHESRVQAAMEFTPLTPAEPAAPRLPEGAVPAGYKMPRADIHPEIASGLEMIPAIPLPAWTPVARSVVPPEIDAAATAEGSTGIPLRGPAASIVVQSEARAPVAAPPVRGPEPAPGLQPGPIAKIDPATRVVAAEPERVLAASSGARVASAVSGATLVRGVMAALAKIGWMEAPADRPGLAAAAVTTAMGGEQLQSLPTAGRRWQELFLGTPTASAGTGSGQLVLRGAGQDPAEMTVDGASRGLAFGTGATSETSLSGQEPLSPDRSAQSGSRGWAGGHGFAMSSAAIREVRVVAGNVEAEGGHAAGGSAEVETESGSNRLHGQGFVFDRQNTWGAKNPFTEWLQNTGTATAPNFTAVPFTPPDREIAWGLGAGSRIRRDRLFWFAALDGTGRNDPGVASVRNAAEFFAQPSNAQMQLLSAQLDLPSTNPVGEGLAAYWPMMENLAGLLGPAQRTSSQWVGFARLDWQAAERHRFTVEGTGADWNSPGGGLTRVSESYGNHSFGSSRAQQEWLLARWEAFVTPNLLAVTQGSAGRDVLSARPEAPSTFEQGFLGSGWNSYGQLPQMVVDSRYGFTMGSPSRFGQGSYPDEKAMHAQEMADWAHGRLLVKGGFELDHNVDATTLLRNGAGSYTYTKVADFVTDALVFEKYGASPNGWQAAPGGQTFAEHNCNATSGNMMGALPCYSYFSQMIGPNYWQVSSNDLAAYVSTQWQASKLAVFSAGLRWEREQLPPPIKLVDNPALPLTERLPDLGNQWGPRVGLAVGRAGRWPVLRAGYGMYFGRIENATLLTALTQTGSLHGDLYFFIRPTDGYTSTNGMSRAPMFPNVLSGPPGSVVVPGAVEYAAKFRNSEVHQGLVSVEQRLPGRVLLTGAAVVSLGRRLPVSIDTNFVPLDEVKPNTITYNVVDKTGKGPIKPGQVTAPFYALRPAAECPGTSNVNTLGQCGRLNFDYQQIAQIESRANSKYEAAMVRVTRNGGRGLTLHAHYTYAHAMDWNPNESTTVAGSDLLDPAHFEEEYGTSNLDVRHSAAAMVIYESPWKLRGLAGGLANGWMISGIGQFRSGLPYSMRTSGAIPRELDTNGNPTIIGLGPGMNGSGGDNRVYGVGRNTFRYPDAWKADVRLGKKFQLREQREIELLAESFNLFNHQNVTEIETVGYEIESSSSGSLPTLNFLTQGTTGTAATTPAFGQPFNVNATDFFRERQFQFGARLRF